MDQQAFFARWSELHGGATVIGIVKWWLSISHAIAIRLQRLRVTANGLTLVGVLLAGALVAAVNAGGLPSLLVALFLLVLSLAADGIDGSLALVTQSESRKGAALDAIADRVSEALWALAFVLLGAELAIVLIAWLFAQIQEYIRARLGGLGIHEVGVVTPSERPVRASLLAVALVITIIFTLFDENELVGVELLTALSLVAALWLILQTIALWLVARFGMHATRD